MNIQQKKTLQIVVKQTLLSCMIFVIGLCYLIFMIIVISISSKMDENQLSVLIDMLYWSRAFMYNGISLCQYLTFSVNSKCYQKICSK